MAGNAVNSKSKGSKNERGVAKLFKEWTGYEFSKTPMSGGLGWSNRDSISGDIVCTDKKHGPYFRFSVECKFHKEINFDHLINGNKKCKILEFWEQANEDSEKSEKIPIVFMRYNGMAKDFHYVILPSEFFDKLKDIFTPTYGILGFTKVSYDVFIILHSEDLFRLPYKQVHLLAKSYLKEKIHGRN